MNCACKKTWKLGAALLPVLLMLLPAAGRAQTCEIPLFVKQGLNGANVMIMADSLGLDERGDLFVHVRSQGRLAGNVQPTLDYFIGGDERMAPGFQLVVAERRPSACWSTRTTAQNGRYSGNYLNWIYYHATDLQRAMHPAGHADPGGQAGPHRHHRPLGAPALRPDDLRLRRRRPRSPIAAPTKRELDNTITRHQRQFLDAPGRDPGGHPELLQARPAATRPSRNPASTTSASS